MYSSLILLSERTNVAQLRCDCDKVAQSDEVLVLLDYLKQVTSLLLLLLLVSPTPFIPEQFDPHMCTGLLMCLIKYFWY